MFILILLCLRLVLIYTKAVNGGEIVFYSKSYVISIYLFFVSKMSQVDIDIKT